MLISAPKFAASLEHPITKQRIYQLIERGDLVMTGKKIDTEHPVNAAWLAARQSAPPPPKGGGRWPAGSTHNERCGPGSNLLPPGPRDPSKPPTPPRHQIPVDPSDPLTGGLDAEEVLAHMSTLDIRRFNKVDIDKLKNLEGMLKIRVERQHKRRELIERSLVQTVFGRLYQIDSNELRVLGARLAPDVAGLLGVDDPEKVLAVEQRIDAEVLKVLAHIQRLLHDYLTAWGAEGGLVI